MASAKQNETLLLTEHFTWPPISLLDDIINAVNDTLYSCTDTLESGLLSAPPSYLGFTPQSSSDTEAKVGERARLEIEEGAQKLETLMIDAVDRNFDRLEIWTLRNVLCLPREEGFERWVRLGHYEGVGERNEKDGGGKEGKEGVTMEGLYEVRRRLVETRRLNALLRGEERRNERVIEGLRKALAPEEAERQRSSTMSEERGAGGEAPLAFLTHSRGAKELGVQGLPVKGKAEARAPLGTHAEFTVSQLPYLRRQLEELKARVGSEGLKGGDGDEGRASERRGYVEGQSRRILEKRGVDTRDGVEGNFEGQMVRGDEIGALEGIVKSVGKERAKGKGDEEGGGEGDDEGEAMDTS